MIKYLLPVMLLASLQLTAQTNTFPPDGNVGVGTLSPENSEGWQKVLEVKGIQSSKTLTSTNTVIAGTWAHNLGIYGAMAGGITGTFTNHPYSFITNKLTRMAISANGNIGIGTVNPDVGLHVYHDFDSGHSGTIAKFGGKIHWTANDYESVQIGFTQLYSIYEGSNLWGFSIRTGISDGSGTEVIRVSGNGNVGINTIHPDAKLAVNGTIHTKEVKVNLTSWPDYVFKPTYNLPSLSQVKTYIDKVQHLPDMPSEQEVARNGINLGEMNSKLLKKVEELTLYLIDQQKEIGILKEKVAKFESKQLENQKR